MCTWAVEYNEAHFQTSPLLYDAAQMSILPIHGPNKFMRATVGII